MDNPKNGFFFDGLLKGVKNIDSKVNLNNISNQLISNLKRVSFKKEYSI